MTPSRIRLVVVLSGVGFAALAFVVWTQPWFTVLLIDGTRFDVAGDAAAPALASLALAALALFFSLTIAGSVLRAILAAIAVAIGLLVAGSAVGVLADPTRAVSSTVTKVTGVAGRASVISLIDSIASTPWAVVAIVAGAGLIVSGIAILLTTRRWPRTSRKYVATSPSSTTALPPAIRERSESGATPPAAAPSQVDARSPIDDWDSLSSGDDPTVVR